MNIAVFIFVEEKSLIANTLTKLA